MLTEHLVQSCYRPTSYRDLRAFSFSARFSASARSFLMRAKNASSSPVIPPVALSEPVRGLCVSCEPACVPDAAEVSDRPAEASTLSECAVLSPVELRASFDRESSIVERCVCALLEGFSKSNPRGRAYGS